MTLGGVLVQFSRILPVPLTVLHTPLLNPAKLGHHQWRVSRWICVRELEIRRAGVADRLWRIIPAPVGEPGDLDWILLSTSDHPGLSVIVAPSNVIVSKYTQNM